MWLETLATARDLGRLHEIASVLIHWGFGDIVHRLGLTHALQNAGRVLHVRESIHLSTVEPQERVARAMEELGPTFVKLGQLLATRVDLFPPVWITAFERLQDEVPAVPIAELQSQIEEVFGADLRAGELSIDEVAFAAASIAQVHKAVLSTGETIVIKFRRPHIERTIEADLHLLARLADLAERNIPELKRFQLTQIVQQFSQSLRRELDLEEEARNAERIAKALHEQEHIVIPHVYWRWTNERVNSQEFIDGVRGRDIVSGDVLGIDRTEIARRGGRAVLHMILLDGFFHADPHLGNLFAMPGNRIAFVDFGMVGRLSAERRDQVADLLYAMVKKDASAVVSVLRLWMERGKAPRDEEELLNSVDSFLERYHGLTVGQLDLTKMINHLVTIFRESQLVLPPDLALLFKTFITLDGVGRRLDPNFNIVEEATPYLTEIMQQRYSPWAITKRGMEGAKDSLLVLNQLPKDVQNLVRSAQHGDIEVKMELNRLDRFGHLLDRAVSRLTIGIVVAALIVGTAVVTASHDQPHLFGMPAWGFIGFIVAVLGGIWLLISIWRGRRD